MFTLKDNVNSSAQVVVSFVGISAFPFTSESVLNFMPLVLSKILKA